MDRHFFAITKTVSFTIICFIVLSAPLIANAQTGSGNNSYGFLWAVLLFGIIIIISIYLILKPRAGKLYKKNLELEKALKEKTNELKGREEELAVINSVQEALVAQLDINEIYNLVGENIRKIFNAQVIDIVTYDHKNNLIEDKYSYEKGDRTLLGATAPKGFRKQVITSREPLIVN